MIMWRLKNYKNILKKKIINLNWKIDFFKLIDELYDVLYYVCALANVYDIDLEKCHILKDKINKGKWK